MNKKLILFFLFLIGIFLVTGISDSKKINYGVKVVEAADWCSSQTCSGASTTVYCHAEWGGPYCIVTITGPCTCSLNEVGHCQGSGIPVSGSSTCQTYCPGYHWVDTSQISGTCSASAS